MKVTKQRLCVAAAPITSRLNIVPRHESAPRKRTLGSMLAASSAIVETTSSISRPFVAPRSRPTNSVASSMAQGASASNSTRQQSSTVDSSANGPAGEFPSIARRVLPADQVSELYGYVRQLHANNDIEAALEGIVRLLQSPNCQELVDLMPKLLGGSISARFTELARSRGLQVAVPAPADKENGASSRTDSTSAGGITSFFAKLQQSKKRRHYGTSETPTAAVIKDPQCSVCYEITRKAYASRCGHICCLGCWKKVGGNALLQNSTSVFGADKCLGCLDGERRVYILSTVQGTDQARPVESDPCGQGGVRWNPLGHPCDCGRMTS